ncbi:MAG: hypothetical protein EA389_07585 [Ilumatobacter sp.]|nr:MAG: hypothetical protein EA389_07585 [Ilumatobacter sp.]
MPIPLDEFPVHQAPLSMAHPATSDRNFYDRSYFNAHDRTGEVFIITGFGVYPNLGVIDAFVTVKHGDQQVTVRTSDALGDDRMSTAVGPYRIEVIEPLERLRVVCDAAEHGIELDMTWQGSFPAIDEPPHVIRRGNKVILDAQRFAQVGTWEGRLVVDGTEFTIDPRQWVGTRDRSWGIRPVGESEPAGRPADDPGAQGFWWLYAPLRFDEFGIVVIVQEEPDGTRLLNEARRVWPASSGRRPEELGWPEFDIRYRPGTRDPIGATIHMADRRRRPVTIEVENLGNIALNSGTGYGGDPSWGHGQWRGEAWTERYVTDLTDPEVIARAAFTPVDHVARATLTGSGMNGDSGEFVGYGLFEHATIGQHDPSGFADFSSVA